MERRDYFLLAGRMACLVLAVATLATAPHSVENTYVLGVFVAVKVMVCFEILWGPFKLIVHVISLRQWNEAGPGDYFAYPLVIAEWVISVAQWGSASAAWGVITDPAFSRHCIGAQQSLCHRYALSSGLAFLLSAISVANATVVLWARMTHGPHALELLGVAAG